MGGVPGTIFNLFLVLFLVLLNGFFVAAEFAIVKVRSTQIAQLKDKRAKIAKKVLANLDPYLSATQLGITLASLGLGWIGEPAIAEMIEPALSYLGMPSWLIHTISFAIAFTIITFLHIILGEIAPKSLAIRRAKETTLWTASPLYAFYYVFKPFILLLNGAAIWILKLMGIKLTDHQQAHTEEEIRLLIEEIRLLISQSHKGGNFDETELDLFDNLFEFSDRRAREIMVPRVNMKVLYRDNTFEENWEIIRKTYHTRFPLCGADKDDIIGIIHIRDVYEQMINKQQPNLENLVRPAILVPETMELKDILRTLQKKRSEMAIVVDEFGGTSGLITTEDIIEEIFGEIQDEFDNEPPPIQKIGSETIIDSRLLIDEVNDLFGIAIEDPDNDTIGGWVFSQLDKIPMKGDQVVYDGWIFIVKEVEQRRVTRLLVKPDPNAKQEIESIS
ncbi:hemolysin family protein [Polycladomyces subterraneus]|uniref:Hemolysin family protein n=1 Tax=Polycladomyces subterraneus TaxID=1016997 RepID=A0ABT8IJN8_9BACL|nr:hemolysin family protein [Polycladomyces subterraneus]MDN4593003.1 hemolysin family protein [Polycladomyces subterraneus]